MRSGCGLARRWMRQRRTKRRVQLRNRQARRRAPRRGRSIRSRRRQPTLTQLLLLLAPASNSLATTPQWGVPGWDPYHVAARPAVFSGTITSTSAGYVLPQPMPRVPYYTQQPVAATGASQPYVVIPDPGCSAPVVSSAPLATSAPLSTTGPSRAAACVQHRYRAWSNRAGLGTASNRANNHQVRFTPHPPFAHRPVTPTLTGFSLPAMHGSVTRRWCSWI